MKFKVGDYIVLNETHNKYMVSLLGVHCKITKVIDLDGEQFKIYHNKLNEHETNYFINSDEFEHIPKEIWESPLFKALHED